MTSAAVSTNPLIKGTVELLEERRTLRLTFSSVLSRTSALYQSTLREENFQYIFRVALRGGGWTFLVGWEPLLGVGKKGRTSVALFVLLLCVLQAYLPLATLQKTAN